MVEFISASVDYHHSVRVRGLMSLSVEPLNVNEEPGGISDVVLNLTPESDLVLVKKRKKVSIKSTTEDISVFFGFVSVGAVLAGYIFLVKTQS